MPRVSEDDIARVREATDLVGLVAERVVLKRKGRLYWACCPFHQEKTPSFKVDPATGLWHCFGCGEGGDAFGFLMKSDNLTFIEALTTLAERAHIPITALEDGSATKAARDRAFAVCKDAALFYHRILTRSPLSQARVAREYLASRGFGSEVAHEWSVGYAPGRGSLVTHLRELGHADEDLIAANVALATDRGILRDRFYERIMFPINDLQGRCCAFGGRILGDGHPKYLNTNDTPIFHKSNTLYGLDRAKNHIVSSKTALIVEGYTDVIALHQTGHRNAVATLGTALTDRHVKLLARFAQRVVYIFDGDEAGLRAADRAVEFIDETITPEATKDPVMLDVVMLPSGKDPADMVFTEAGRMQLDESIDNSVPLITFALQRRLSAYDLSRPEQQIRALTDAAAVLAPIKSSSIAVSYARDLADMLAAKGSAIDAAQVMTAVSKARVLPRRSEEVTTFEVITPPTEDPSSECDPLEIETLGLMIANPRLRSSMGNVITSDMFSSAQMAALFETVRAADSRSDSASLLNDLTSSDERVASMFSHYDFEEGARASDSIGDMFVRGIRAAYGEREIRTLMAQMRAEKNAETKKEIMGRVAQIQKQILSES